MLVGDRFDILVRQERRVGRTEGRISLSDNVLGLEVLDELVLREIGVKLDLAGTKSGQVRADASNDGGGEGDSPGSRQVGFWQS